MSYMIKQPENTGSKFPPLPAGSYGAICYAIIGIGSHHNPKFNNSSRKMIIIWEIPDELIDINGEEKPKAISEQYTESLAEKANLRAMLESWRGKSFSEEELNGFDISKLLGAPCMLTTKIETSKTGREFAKISGVGKLPKGMTLPDKPFNPVIIFSVDDIDAFEKMKTLPEWIQSRIKESEEYKKYLTQSAHESGFQVVDVEDTDLPF